MAICRNLLGANALEKSSETIAGMASIFPMCLRSNILRFLAISYFGFRVESELGNGFLSKTNCVLVWE